LVIGIVTYRHRETPRTWAVALVAALTTLALTAWWVFGMYVLSDFRLAGPKLGAYQVALGAVIAAIASVRLRKIGQMDRWSN
jgi:threonine/homoserine efflux transporter RhtA